MQALRVMAIVTGFLLVAACGSSDDDDSDTSVGVGTEATATAVPTTAAIDAASETTDDAAATEDPTPDPDPTTVDPPTPEPAPVGPTVELAIDGLPPLEATSEYEAWLIADGAASSLGRFRVDADGEIAVAAADAFTVAPGVAETATNPVVAITIEPAGDADPAPSATTVLAGDLVDGAAILSVQHPSALATDFADAGGSYLLGTPTDGQNNNELSGVWFIDLPTAAGLSLPPLPPGWQYEGWAIIAGQPVTTGRFSTPEGADGFSGFSGDQGGPPFPGEDFIVNPPDGLVFPTDLRDATIAISVEPEPDTGPAPFAIRPLVHEVPDGIGDHQLQFLEPAGIAPSGTATLVTSG